LPSDVKPYPSKVPKIEFSVSEIFPIIFPEEPVNNIFPFTGIAEIVFPCSSDCDCKQFLIVSYMFTSGSSVGIKLSHS
jgi:hypothetical protein